MNVMDAEKAGNNAKVEWYQENLGIEFEYIPVNWGDWGEKVATWIATQDTPDLIWWDLKGAQSNQYRTWARQGAFQAIPVDKFLAKPDLGKITQKMIDDGAIEVMTVDGELYCFPAYRNNPPESQNAYDSFFAYRADWAKAVGLHKEDNIYTFDEWVALCKAVIEQDPGGNGPGNTAALVMPPWGFPHAAVLFIGQVPAVGNETAAYMPGPDGKYIWPPSTPEYREDVKTTWQLYQDGIIWKDNIMFNGSEDQDMWQAGTSFTAYNALWTVENMMRDGIITSLSDVQPAIVQDKNGKIWLTQTENYWTVTAFSPSVDEAKMDRIIEFWDFLNSEKGILMKWLGLEGKDYELNSDGSVNVLWEMNDGVYINPYREDRFPEFTPSSLAPPGNPGETTFQLDTRRFVWNAMANNNSQMKLFDYQVSFLSGQNKDRFGDFGMDVKAKLIELIVSSTDIESDWDAFIESMMPRVQPVLDEINDALT